jgi:hypothetical protein
MIQRALQQALLDIQADSAATGTLQMSDLAYIMIQECLHCVTQTILVGLLKCCVDVTLHSQLCTWPLP